MENAAALPQSITLTSAAERTQVAFATSANDFLAMASLKAPFFEEKSRVAVDIVTVIDRSGSMGDQNKMGLVKETLGFMVQQLKGDDRLALIIYDEFIETPLPLTKMSAEGKRLAQSVVDAIRPRGSTDLCGGLLRGLDTIKARVGEMNKVASVLLFTDGLANHGISHTAGILQAMAGLPVASDGNNRNVQGYQNINAINPMIQSPHNPMIQAPQQMQMPQMQMQRRGQMQMPAQARMQVPAESSKPLTVTAIDLPCSVHTFGFGSDHDTNMLRAISDAGSGTYFFLKDKDDIPDAFADCLGGLLSVVGQNISIKFKSTQGIPIKKILTKFKTTVEDAQTQTVTIGDIQSEEERDILLSLDLPALPHALYDTPLLEVTLSYFNVITSQLEESYSVVSISRPSAIDEANNKVNFKLDLQRNRIATAEAMENAKKQGDAGNLTEARATINNAIAKLRASISSSDKFVQGLIHDLEKALEGLQDNSAYVSYGAQQMNTGNQMHWNQRAAQKTWSPSYETSSRSAQKANFSKH